jgi:folate-binding protein YgfZ
MAMICPFAKVEKTAGATFAERFGVEIPADYGDPMAEYWAVRRGAGLLDMSFRGMLRLTGGERVRWLNGQITSEVKSLRAGEGTPAAVLTVKGRLLAELAVYGTPDAVVIDLQRDRAEAARAAFDRHIIADDVRVEDVSDRFARLTVAGPAAASIVADATGADVAALAPWCHREGRIGDTPVRIAASRWLRMPALDLVAPVESAERMWEALARFRDALRPVGMTALEWLRVEAGWALFGIDYDDETLLMEALTTEHVSFTKGCYVGQEVVTRIEHQGRLNRRLCGLVLTGEAVPPPGTLIFSGERQVGRLTSAVRSPTLGRAIGLAMLRRDCWESGTTVRIGAEADAPVAETTSLPFVQGWGLSEDAGAVGQRGDQASRQRES